MDMTLARRQAKRIAASVWTVAGGTLLSPQDEFCALISDEGEISFRVFDSSRRELFWDYAGTAYQECESLTDEALRDKLRNMLPAELRTLTH
jgi:hypothetical protein